MTDLITPNYGLTLPEPGASNDTWAGKLNGNFSLIDSAMGTLSHANADIDASVAVMVARVPTDTPDGKTVRVLGRFAAGDGGGGMFQWAASDTTTTNTGTIFAASIGGAGRWKRVIEVPWVDVRWFGVVQDLSGGSTPRSTEAQAAYDFIVANQPYCPSALMFPSGYYNINMTLSSSVVDVIGVGRPQMRPDVKTTPVFSLTNAVTGYARPRLISGFDFNQDGTTYTGTAIQCGAGVHQVRIDLCQFRYFSKSLDRSFGNFGMTVANCGFEASDYHIYSTDTVAHDAHGGDITIQDGHMRGARLACFYLDSTTGQSGKYLVKNTTIEANDGYVWFILNANDTGTGVPAIEHDSAWNEGNALGGSITVGGVTAAPTWAYIKNCGMFIVRNTPPAAIQAINSTIVTRDSDLTYTSASTIDSTSYYSHDGARWTNYQNIAGIVRSVTHVDKGSGTAASVGSWYQTLALASVLKASGATVHKRSDSSANLTYTGTASITTTSQTDSGIGGLTTCQDLAITGAKTESSPDSGATTVASGRYLCWVWVGKLLSGTAPQLRIGVTTGSHISLYRTISETDFVTLKGMVPLDTSVSFLGLEYVATATCTIREAGWAVLSFASLQQALAFLNSSVFPA